MMTLPKLETETVSITLDGDVTPYTGIFLLARHVITRGKNPIIGTIRMSTINQWGTRKFSVEVEK